MNVRVGSKVKCIKDGGWNNYKLEDGLEDKVFPNPVYGEIYTVVNYIELSSVKLDRVNFLGLQDGGVIWLEGMGEQCFTTRRFELVEY